MTPAPTNTPTAAVPTMFGCVSHSPLIAIRPKAPPQEAEILAHCEAFRAQAEAFRPDRILFFTNNHFAGFHYANMPAYCVGTRAIAVPDLGGAAGEIPVPSADSIALIEHLRAEGFDPGISYRMSLDHAVSQPLLRLIGAIDRYPLIPLFISVFTPPLMRFQRSRLIGEAVGRWIAAGAAAGTRTLIMGSGGISHHPVRYFPLMGTAEPRVHGYQLEGERGGTMTDAEWFTRFADMRPGPRQRVADEQALAGPGDRLPVGLDHRGTAQVVVQQHRRARELVGGCRALRPCRSWRWPGGQPAVAGIWPRAPGRCPP
jgi:hypothetical protein